MGTLKFVKGAGWILNQPSPLLLVDYGGTYTRFFLIQDNHIIKRVRLRSDLNRLLKKINEFKGRQPVQSLLVGLRGVWTSREKSEWKNKLRPVFRSVQVMSDIELALRLNLGHQPGIVLNAGTGSVAMGRNAMGRMARAGGWGPLLGDEGSAFWIGREKLKSQRNRPPSYYIGPKAVSRIAQLGYRSVHQEGMRERAQIHLFDLVQDVQSQLKMNSDFLLVLRGGLFENKAFQKSFIFKIYREKFEGIIQNALF